MLPGKRDIKIYKGATDRLTFWMKDAAQVPINLTGAVVHAYISDGVKVNYEMGSGITTVPLEGKVVIVMSKESKANLGAKGTWSVKIDWPNGDTNRILEGKVDIVAEP